MESVNVTARGGPPLPGLDTPRVVLITAPDDAVARGLARGIIEARLAACVNLVPKMVSVYRWQDAVEEANEALLVVKTVHGRLRALQDHVKRVHPYAVAEFVALDPYFVSADYLAWLVQSCAP